MGSYVIREFTAGYHPKVANRSRRWLGSSSAVGFVGSGLGADASLAVPFASAAVLGSGVASAVAGSPAVAVAGV